MITKIVAQLKTGSVANVVPFGMGSLPAPPYTVVKGERDPTGAGTLYRIIAHYSPGQITFLEDYIKNEVPTLLDKFGTLTRHGNYQRAELTDEWGGLITDNDDSTISMEKVFLVPGKVF